MHLLHNMPTRGMALRQHACSAPRLQQQQQQQQQQLGLLRRSCCSSRSGNSRRVHHMLTLSAAASPDTLEQTGTTAAATTTTKLPVQEQESGPFNWHHAWYPVAVVSQLDEARPTATQLLGMHMAIWKDGSGNWVVFEDRCPHRLAPLSEGRLEASTGHLMCSYHGWQFDSQGRCTSIPQIGEPAAHAAACSSKRTCAITYPSQVAQGLLWVWPDASSSNLAAASLPALSSQYGAQGWTLLGGEWFARDLEYGFDTMMENLFDPSHIPFAHHGIMGTASRDKAQPLHITTKVDVTPTGGFQLFRDSAPFRTAAPTDTINSFVPPVLNASSQTNTVKGTTLVLTFYGIPTAPGKCRVITAFFTNAKVPAFAAKLASAVEWVFHLGQNQVLDSDAMLLHVQERLLHEGRDPNWRSAFYMPAGADLGIIKFRGWYQDCAGGSIPWPGSLAQQPLGPVKSRDVVMDRFTQHTAHCKSCSAAVKWIQRLQAVSLGLSGIAAAACTAAVTAAAVTAGSTTGVSAAAAGGDAGLVQAVAGVLAALPAWQCVLLGVLAAALLFAHRQLGQLKQRFFFIDYEHWNRK